MIYVSTWNDVVEQLRHHPWRTRMRLQKGILPHPKAVGMKASAGIPEGQVADFRFVLKGGVGLHVKDFQSHYEAHLDEVHPGVDFVEHLRQDSPGTFISGSAVIGALVGGLLTRSWQGALAGAAITGLIGTGLAAEAQEDDAARKRTT